MVAVGKEVWVSWGDFVNGGSDREGGRTGWICCTVGLAAYWAWGILITQHSAIFQNRMSEYFSHDVLFAANQVIMIVSCLAMMALCRIVWRAVISNGFFLVCSVAVCAASLLQTFGPQATSFVGYVIYLALYEVACVGWIVTLAKRDGILVGPLVCSIPVAFLLVTVASFLPPGTIVGMLTIVPCAAFLLRIPVHMDISVNGTPFMPAPLTTKILGLGYHRKSCLMWIAYLVASIPLAFFKSYFSEANEAPPWLLVTGISLVITAIAAIAISQLKSVVIEKATFLLPAAFLLIGMLLISDGGLEARTGLAGSFVYVGDYLCRALIYYSIMSASRDSEGAVLVGRIALATLFILAGRLTGQVLGIVCVHINSLLLILTVAVAAILVAIAVWVVAHFNSMPNQNNRREFARLDLNSVCQDIASRVACQYMLTEREGQVLVLILKGLSAKSIGAELCLSPSTVKSHMDRIYKKTNVHTRDELVALAHACEAQPSIGGLSGKLY